MRYIPRNCIQPEAVLAKPILGANGEVLLNEGTAMKPVYINRLEELGIGGAYVNDPISEDLEIVGAVSDELRSYAIKNIFSLYSKASADRSDTRDSAIAVMKTAEMIVDEILEHGDVMLNIFDVKSYDSYTFFHCVSVTVLAIVMGIGSGLDRNDLVKLAYGALLHDIGKIFIPSVIINKPGRLTPEEFDIVKKHPYDGYAYIKKNFYLTVPEISAIAVREHHERVDGSGYPNGTKSERICHFAKILAIADVYDALVSDRPYRKGMFAVEAMDYILGGCGTMFDHELAAVFARKIALFPVGSSVLLSDGTVGLVMANYEGFAQRPLLKVFRRGEKLIEPYFLNLRQGAYDITVVAAVEA